MSADPEMTPEEHTIYMRHLREYLSDHEGGMALFDASDRERNNLHEKYVNMSKREAAGLPPVAKKVSERPFPVQKPGESQELDGIRADLVGERMPYRLRKATPRE